MPYPFLDEGYYTPINDMKAVTPSDTVDLQLNGVTLPCRALYFNGTGNIVFDTAGGTTVTLTIPATATGVVQYIRAKRIRATGTTIGAGNIFACY